MSKTKKKRSEKVYKTLTIIFGIATIVFGTASVWLTIYSIRLQKRESESKERLQQIENLLSSLSNTTSSKETQDLIKYIQSKIPGNYRSYVRSIGKLADSLVLYEKKLRRYERKIAESLLPNKPCIRSPFTWKGHTVEEGWLFEFLEPVKTIKVEKNIPSYLPIKLNIPFEVVYCFHVRLMKENIIVGTYDYFPQGTYNKLTIQGRDTKDTLIAYVGIFLKEDIKKQYPTFYNKQIKVAYCDGK